MKCVILHESPGRLRLHAAASRMTLTQADAWEAYLKALPGVRDAAVYDRTGDLVITYRGSREEILRRMQITDPVLLESIPLTLEEIFIYELGGVEYAAKDILL